MEYKYVVRFGDDAVNWWDWIYYRNYKLWNNTLSSSELSYSMLQYLCF